MLLSPHRIPAGWFRAVATMVGAMIGVGIFGLPYAFAQSGFVIGAVELCVFGLLMLVLFLMFAEIVMQTKERHLFPGYVRHYLGKTAGHVAIIVMTLSGWGAMIAYIIVGGNFFKTLFYPLFDGPEIAYQIVIALVALLLTYNGFRFLSRVEFFIVGTLLFLFFFLVFISLPEMHLTNLFSFHLERVFAPYGVILFAFGGISIIAQLKSLFTDEDMHRLPHAVFTGHMIISFIYFLFAFTVVGMTGNATTENAFDGLVAILGPVAGFVGALLGSITVLSIFSLIAIQLQETLKTDYHIPHKIAWLSSIVVPLLLFLFGLRDFISLIGFIGAVFGGLIAILVILTYEKMQRSAVCRAPRHCLDFPGWINIILVLVFGFGIVLEVLHLF